MGGGSPAPVELAGRTSPFLGWQKLLLAALALLGVWLRVRHLSAEGFSDDEVHKWLAALRYLHGDFGGDDVEHPMLMKWLIAGSAAILPRSLAPETLTRLPNALAAGGTIVAVALLGRRYFGRGVALLGAALCAFSTTFIGYQRIAKEDTLLGLFLALMLWCFGEAHAAAQDGRAADQRRWEAWAAAALGGMFASKYFIFFAPIPLFAYWALRARGTAWRIPFWRWVVLIGIGLLVFSAVNWTPFLPSTWEYIRRYLAGDRLGDRSTSETLLFRGRLYGNLAFNWRGGVPPWFHLAFAWVKLAPPTAILAFAGIGWALWRRRPAHLVFLCWIGTFVASFTVSASMYGRFFVSVLPAFALLAAHAANVLARRVPWRAAFPALAVLMAGSEASAAAAYAPHYRLYVNALGGGDAALGWWFPHCDYFDAGLREAVEVLAARAEPGAEIASETEWPVRFYAERAGRTDLAYGTLTRKGGCRQGRVCYAVTAAGRIYGHNREALERLAGRSPWETVAVRGVPVVKVYRLEPGEPLFPPGAGTAAATR
ncbi:MAG TPA: glycosyltransferase family 39 protein [Anaeromyxobacteraceae bacterium]|jgi:4-amino-4-deoxy-L-arabinose transferase-like glycosyltransferase|nr:glycosyltransferase family 39 protein [Anaeromyxobacteraceae bacterium]